jgi:hypothetical protein
MRKRRTPVILLLLLCLFFPANETCALGAEKPWFGGLYTGFCGFSEQTGLPAGEYLAAGLFAEPINIPALNPALLCGVLIPLSPANTGGMRVQVAGELTIVDLPVSFLKNRFYISSDWSPGVGAHYLFTFDSRASWFSVLIAPLRFRTGDAVFTVGSIELFIAANAGLQGWGFTLFKAALFLF